MRGGSEMGGGEASRYDVVVFGVYFCDLIFTGLEEMPKLGTELYSSALDVTVGGPFNTVLALHRLGSRVGWSCDFGDDFFSRFVLDYVRNEGLDDALFRVHPFPVRSVTVAASLPQDRAFITYADHRDAPLPVPLVQRHRPRAVFLPDLPHGEEARGLYAAAREASCVVHGGLADGEIMLGTPGVEEALRSLDVFTPNLDEALRLTDAGSAEEAVETLAALAPTVAVKLGAEGAIGRRGGRTARVPAIDVDPFDTTGAGDCFDAGFLHGHLRGDSLEDCLRLGNVCGGLATTATGSRATPSLAEAKRRLAEHYPKTAQRAALKEAQER